MQKITQQENSKSAGLVTFKRYAAGTLNKVRPLFEQAQLLAKEAVIERINGHHDAADYIENRRQELRAAGKAIMEKHFLGIGAQYHNLIVTGAGGYGRNIIARQLTGDTTYALAIAYGEIGTGSTAPANSDTALTTPTLRKAVEDTDLSNNVATISFFMTDAELANGTYYEFGTFIGGSITIGTGRLFNHALFSPSYVKATGEDTTIEVEFTIN